MNLNSNQIFKGSLIGVIILLTFNLNISSYVIGNRGGDSFNGNSTDSSKSIESYIIDSAGEYLAGYSNYLSLLNKIEMSGKNGVDYTELGALVDITIDRISKARTNYESLVQTMAATPYNPVVIESLKTFDYNGFRKENGLTSSIFDRVKGFLSKGDVRGIFAWIHENTAIALNRLNQIKSEVDAGQFPNLSNLWRINQTLSETLLTGQFTAEVFHRIDE
jgi:hypothetical protein